MKKNVNLSRIVATILTLFMVWGGVTGCKPAVENITVTFDSDGGSAVESIVVEKGKSIETAPTSEKEGYTLDGWYNGETKVEFPYTPEADVTLKAKWVETKTEEPKPEEPETEEPETEEPETEEPEPEDPKPEDPKPEAKWPNALPSGKGATFTVNADGTVSSTFTAADNGNGIVVYINKDKSAVAAGSTVKFSFDYETVTGWSDDTKTPKFKLALKKDAKDYTDSDTLASAENYKDTNETKGNVAYSLKADKECNQLLIQFNAYEWPGAVTDSVKITLKSVEVIVPDPNAKEEVIFEGEFSNYSVLSTKTDLTEKKGKTLVLTFRKDTEESRDGYGIGVIAFATDKNDVYSSKTTETIGINTTTFTDNLCDVEFSVDEILSTADGEIITANVYNACVLIKAAIK